MKRIEIIANKTVEEDILAALGERRVGGHYTLIPAVRGAGKSGPRRGDSVWPEENFMLIIYAESFETEEIKAAVREVKKIFPAEGIKVFEMP